METLVIFITVDGVWASWGSYGACTVTCGGGTQERQRTCTNPVPQYGGANCPGSTVSSQACNTQNCPSEYGVLSIFKKVTCTYDVIQWRDFVLFGQQLMDLGRPGELMGRALWPAGAGPSPERAPAQTRLLNMAELPAQAPILRHRIVTLKSASVSSLHCMISNLHCTKIKKNHTSTILWQSWENWSSNMYKPVCYTQYTCIYLWWSGLFSWRRVGCVGNVGRLHQVVCQRAEVKIKNLRQPQTG